VGSEVHVRSGYGAAPAVLAGGVAERRSGLDEVAGLDCEAGGAQVIVAGADSVVVLDLDEGEVGDAHDAGRGGRNPELVVLRWVAEEAGKRSARGEVESVARGTLASISTGVAMRAAHEKPGFVCRPGQPESVHFRRIVAVATGAGDGEHQQRCAQDDQPVHAATLRESSSRVRLWFVPVAALPQRRLPICRSASTS